VDAENVSRLRRVIGRLARLLNAAPVSENLTPTQASVLALVTHRAPIGMTELAEIEGLNPTMLSRVVARLVEDGLVRRLPNPNDQRAVQLDATERGSEAHSRIIAARTATVAQVLGDLPPEFSEALSNALPALEALAEGLRTQKS
jgi:DNA-binding MarR family transcriptional regulator